MNAYVLGAGVSKCVGYPVGNKLFDEIDKYVRESGNLTDRFNYREDWRDLHHWLETNANPTIVQAYHSKNIEHLFTVLDFAAVSLGDALSSAAFESGGTEVRTAIFDDKIKDYQKYRRVLLWALEHYFEWHHHEDYGRWKNKNKEWDTLRAFGDGLKPGDAIITFNYDGALERVLLDQGKWLPSDGYGFKLVFQKSHSDKTEVALGKSPILILHLHGATGWYRRPTFAPDYVLQPGIGGSFPPEALGAAPIDTDISLDPQFLKGLGIYDFVDACLPDLLPVSTERQVVLHPSFLKDYETDESDSHVFIDLWQRAAQVLREAEHTYIIGYSLPKADVAALTLFLATIRRGAVTVVNPAGSVVMRLGRLFSGNPFGPALTLEQWLAS